MRRFDGVSSVGTAEGMAACISEGFGEGVATLSFGWDELGCSVGTSGARGAGLEEENQVRGSSGIGVEGASFFSRCRI